MKRHPESSLTISEAYALWSDHWRDVQAPATRSLRLWQWQWWEKYSSNPPLRSIGRETFIEFRKQAIADGLSVETVETCLNAVVSVLNQAKRRKVLAELPDRPKRIRAAPKKAPAATLDEFSRFCRHACKSKLPKLHRAVTDRGAFWGAFLGAFYFTGLRRSDVELMLWSNIGPDEITICAQKTGKVQIIPVHPVLRKLLDKWRPQTTTDRVFPHCRVTTMRCFHGLRYKAATPTICPQAIRKLAARQYEAAHGGAGAVVLGHAIQGATIYYLSAVEILRKAQETLAVPECFVGLLPETKETDLLSVFKSMDKTMQATLCKLLEAMGVLKGKQSA